MKMIHKDGEYIVVLSNNSRVILSGPLNSPEDIFKLSYVSSLRQEVIEEPFEEVEDKTKFGTHSSYKSLKHGIAGQLIREGKEHLVPKVYQHAYASLTRLNPDGYKLYKVKY